MQQSNAGSEMNRNNNSANSSADNQQVTQQQQQQQPHPANNNQQPAGEEPRKLSLADLFKSKDDGEGYEISSDDSESDDPSKPPETLEALSKRLQLKPEQIYGIQVAMPNGAEPLTIGQLKDRIGELVDFETREAQFDQRRVKAEGELLRAQTEMREILALIPKGQLNPELVNKMRQRHEATTNRERELTMEHIPDWQNEKTRTEDLKGMVEMLSDYGFEPSFISTVVDHRALKFIRDSYLRDKRIKAALAKVTTPAGKAGQRPSGKSGKAPSKPGAAPSKKQGAVPSQRARIENLFNRS